MTYKVVLQPSDEGYRVSCPGLPGRGSQGPAEQEAPANIEDAIRKYLAAIEDPRANLHQPSPIPPIPAEINIAKALDKRISMIYDQ
jgi:predicted RNase H-like HicB family nuclease